VGKQRAKKQSSKTTGPRVSGTPPESPGAVGKPDAPSTR
jgi:hypothetical protein